MTTPVKILVASLVATTAMTMLMLVAPLMGMPPMNIGAMLGGMLGASATVGRMMHFMIGVLFTAAYAIFFNRRLTSACPSTAPWVGAWCMACWYLVWPR